MSKQNLTCANCGIRHLTLFADLPVSSFENIDFTNPIVSRHRPNEVLSLNFGAESSIYTIREGVVKLEARLGNGGRRILRLLKRGDTLGLHQWQLGKQAYDAVALGEVELCRIPYRVLESLRQDFRVLNEELIARCCQDSQQADMWITQFSTGTVPRRLAYLVLFLLELEPSTQVEMVRLLSRDDMAAILGVRQESISRTVTQFKREGMLIHKGKDMYQVDAAGLERKLSEQTI